jgi:hypothetical protein
MSITKQFVLAGNACFTIEVPAGTTKKDGTAADPHYTFLVERVPASDRFPEAYFIKYLSGPDNTTDFLYVGKLNPTTGQVALTNKSKLPPTSFRFRLLNRVLARVWAGDQEVVEKAGYGLHHEGKCGRCGRRLTVPASIKEGIGPECIKMGPGYEKGENTRTVKTRKAKGATAGAVLAEKRRKDAFEAKKAQQRYGNPPLGYTWAGPGGGTQTLGGSYTGD